MRFNAAASPFLDVRSPKDDPGVSHEGTSQEAELHGDGNREIAVRTLIFKNAKLQEARGQIGSTAPLLGPWGNEYYQLEPYLHASRTLPSISIWTVDATRSVQIHTFVTLSTFDRDSA